MHLRWQRNLNVTCKTQKSVFKTLYLILVGFPLRLKDFHDDLLLLDEESAHDLLPHGLVTEDAAVSPEHLLMAEGKPRSVSGSRRLHALELEARHRALGHRRPLLEVLEDEASSGRPRDLASVAARVVRQPPTIRDALNHLKRLGC